MRLFLTTLPVALLLPPTVHGFATPPSAGVRYRRTHRPKAAVLLEEDEELDIQLKQTLISQQLEEQAAALLSLNNHHYGILHDIDGRPLDLEFFLEHMDDIADEDVITSYTAQDAFRGFMSNAMRVTLHPTGETAFYKDVVFGELAHSHTKSLVKLRRDVRSYEVVANFLQSQAREMFCQRVGGSSVVIPKLYHADLAPCRETPMRSKFGFLLQDLRADQGWYQQWLLEDEDHAHASLKMYAQMHAYFWSGSEFYQNDDNHESAVEELRQGVWPSGSYVQPLMQGGPEVACSNVASEWKTKRSKFQKELQDFPWWDTLGDRLQQVSQECGRLAHPFATKSLLDFFADDDDNDDTELTQQHYARYKTFTHGDPKQANLLFKRDNDNNDQLAIGLIDFQWAGFGLAATDVAHHVTSAVHAGLLVDGGEERLLQFYFDQLQTHWEEYGVPTKNRLSFDAFMEQYEVAVLDICRLMIAYTWSRFTEAVTLSSPEEARERTLNKTSYNKSIPNIVWLLNRCDQILTKRGV